MAANSTLQIEVVSKGIADTVTKLDSLGNAAARNEVKVKLLTDSLGLLMTAQDNAVVKASQHAMLMSSIAQQMGLASDAAKQISVSVNNLAGSLNGLNTSADKTVSAFHQMGSSGGIVNATIRAMTTAALAYFGINFAKGIIEAADGWRTMQARLKLALGSMEEAKVVQNDLFDVAQRLRVPLDDISKLYTRMSIPMQRLGKDAKQTADQVEFVALALKLNGATAAEASSVMLQYSQSVNAGRLNGAEFNSVAEGAPGILRAIEAELKATGKWSEFSGKTLKQMGADGEISFDLMNRAAQRALPEFRKQFAELPLTVDGAMQRIKNAWFKAMGEMGEDTQMGKKIALAIGQLEKDIPRIRDALASTFIFLQENFSKIVAIIEGLVIGKFVQWIAGAALALPALYTGLMATATALGAAATGMALLRVGLMALAGPIGIIVALVGVDLVSVYKYFAKEAPKADAEVTATTKINTVNRTLMIQKEIDKIVERNRELTKGKIPVEVKAPTLPNDILKLQSDIYAREAKQKFMTDEGQIRISKQVIAASKEHLAAKLLELPVLKALNEVNAEDLRLKTVAGVRSQLALKVEDKPAQANREVKEWEQKFKDAGGILSEKEKILIRLNVLGTKGTERDPYKELRASLATTRLELELNILTGEKATAMEKVRAAMDAGKNKDYRGLSDKDKSTIDEDVKKNLALEEQIKVRDALTEATALAEKEHQKLNDSLTTGITSINKETEGIRLQTAALAASKTVVKDAVATSLEGKAANLELLAGFADADVVQRDLFRGMAEAYRIQAAAQRELGIGQDTKKAKDLLDELLDPKRAMTFGTALADSFGEVGASIGKMSKALGFYSSEETRIANVRKSLTSLPADAARQKGLALLDEEETRSKLRMYGAMAGGIKSLFSQHTAAYKVLGVAEQGFRAAELAGTIYNYAVKEGLVAAFTGLFTTAKATEATVESAQTLFILSERAAAGAGDIAITGATEAAKNTLKIPGVLMSFMSWLGPFGMAAGGLAIAAVIGASMSGGGGGGGDTPVDYKARQASQGTGTVLGDDSVKSASIVNSLTGLESNSNIGLVLTSNMLSSLRGIEASMLGLSTAIYKVPGMTTGKNFGITEGKQGGGFLSSVFGGDTVTSITDTGLSLNGTANQFKQGAGIQQYVDINKQESGGWFSDDSSSNSRNMMGANSEITKTIGKVFDSISTTIATAAVSLGGNGESVRAALDAFVVDTEVSFKGLKGDELQQALNAVFSASADSMAQLVFPGLMAFQKAGEGYYQTVMRVSSGTEQAQNALKGLGVAAISRDAMTNKTGDFAAEMVRQSIMTANAGKTMAEVMRLMSGNLSELVDGYKSLLAIQDTMRGAKLGDGISMDTIRGAGGISELKSALQTFVDGFYSDNEKRAISLTKLKEEFSRLNTAMPETKDGFRQLVTALMAGDGASKELAGRVMLLSGAFAEAHAAVETAKNDAITKAKDNLSAAYDKESKALETTAEKMKSFSDTLKAFKETLIMGDLSPKSTSEKYATAKANYDSTATLALGGDQKAIANFDKSAAEMLKLSRDMYASGSNYTSDYDRVLLETEALRKYTSEQVDVATASLDALKLQVKGLLDIKESVMTVTAAIEALQAAMYPPVAGMQIDGSHAGGLSNVPFDGYIAELHRDERVLTASENRSYSSGGNSLSSSELAEEIKALRNEVCMLRADQREQTSNIIVAQYDSTERNAHAVVSSNKDAVDDASYFERTKKGLV